MRSSVVNGKLFGVNCFRRYSKADYEWRDLGKISGGWEGYEMIGSKKKSLMQRDFRNLDFSCCRSHYTNANDCIKIKK